ncbi:MAG: hypothetical protein JXR91_06730 [Deltaproteobacteria bacterium]|nr:hypothetical protein [Deltaproteobacteria bacterium]
MFMRKSIILSALAFSLLQACGAPPPPPVTTVTPPPPVIEQPVQEPVQAEIQRTQPVHDQKKCSVTDQEDGTNMVVSNLKDWFLYVPLSAKVECGTFGGDVTIEDGPVTIMVKSLVPNGTADKTMEAEFRGQTVKYITTSLREKYGSAPSEEFKEVKIGKYKRPALCIDAPLDLKGTKGQIAACVTSKTNADGEIIIHRVLWIGPLDEYNPKETFTSVKKSAAAWFRYSDTDGMGKLMQNW